MFEVFEHTADLGIRIRAVDLPALFSEAGRGLLAVIVEDPEDVRPAQSQSLQIEAQQTDLLLFDWLNELLFLFDARHLLSCRFDVACHQGGLSAVVWGEPLDLCRHRTAHEVKAITYHGLTARQEPEGWLAEVIVDI